VKSIAIYSFPPFPSPSLVELELPFPRTNITKVAVALHNELGRVPKAEEIEQLTLFGRVLYKAVLGLHYKRKEQKKSGQLAIF
jgi:hypothetical protein